MESAAENVTSRQQEDSPKAQLSQLFGSYRAEWLREHIFDMFTSPGYFPELVTGRPCMLVGGRGTGKTTALRAMSWEGQRRLSGTTPSAWPFFGVYYRVNTNRVTALRGPELPESEWQKLFAHYFNLIISERLLRFAVWYEEVEPTSMPLRDANDLDELVATLGIQDATDPSGLEHAVRRARVAFEAYVNNVVDAERPFLSLQGAPIEALIEALGRSAGLDGKPFFILVDEYENLLDDQQRVLNTLIKHSTDRFVFKIGVREMGWRQRTTLNEHEQLRSPADYVRIDIAEKLADAFPQFAAEVCNERISRLSGPVAVDSLGSIQALFPHLSEDDEAHLLGVADHANSVREALETEFSAEELVHFDQLPPLFQYLIGFWAQAHSEDLVDTYRDFLRNGSGWLTRYGNYKHALLYTLRRGRRGVSKYYAGHGTFAEVCGVNIRFYLQLVEQALLQHFDDNGTLANPVSPKTQTEAAQQVGRVNLGELEGLSVYGMYLSRLVLGLGRVFQVMAAQLERHAPEVNEFYLVEDKPNVVRSKRAGLSELPIEIDALLSEAVMHLALLRFPGTKPTGPGDTEEYDYALHPIFSPLFAFSYRRKRKMALTRLQLAGLMRSPRATIRDVLAGSRRSFEADEPLPEQLGLFEAFYSAGD